VRDGLAWTIAAAVLVDTIALVRVRQILAANLS
jgi:hypothetical protein